MTNITIASDMSLKEMTIATTNSFLPTFIIVGVIFIILYAIFVDHNKGLNGGERK